VDRPTVEIYEAQAGEYEARRPARHTARAAALAADMRPGLPCADLGCGPGAYLGALAGAGTVVGVDAAYAMVDRARRRSPETVVVQGDLETLPFRAGALGGAWARNTYVHVAKARLPLALAHLHRAMALDAPLEITALVGDDEGPLPDDDLAGRFFARWPPERFAEVVTGAGFAVERTEVVGDAAWVRARRARTLPDFVGPDMRLLVCGLNPSLVAADAGFGYAGATNRFWPTALAAGLLTRARDPVHALAVDGIGMTDLVKRATPRADLLGPSEYTAGVARVRRLVEWLRPGAVAFVGLAGWRAAVDRQARPGLQPGGFAGVPAYVMPSTSGLNARTSRDELVDHLRRAGESAGSSGPT
jgi:TDG/mug DNA glycosylase family protein